MVKLTVDELDLLKRIRDKEELRPYFFQKVKGLKWFDSLCEAGYFNPDQNPQPVSAREEGYVQIPFWPALEYLVSTSSEFRFAENKVFAKKFIEIIRSVTNYAIERKISNFRTWRQFAKIIQNIPSELVQESDIALIDYWLNDPYERGLIVEEIGVKWLAALLESNNGHCKKLAVKLLDNIYKLEFHQSKHEFGNEKEVWLRFRHWDAKKVTEKIAGKAGKNLGVKAIKIFQDRLESILVTLNNDRWTYIWRPAIEKHEQNHITDNTKDIILEAFRDSMLAYIETYRADSCEYVEELLKSPFNTIGRLALYAIDQQFQYLSAYIDHINKNHFNDNFRHELWHLLRNHYSEFRPEQKFKILETINNIVIFDETRQKEVGSTAYQQLIWLSAIKDYGDEITQLYRQCLEIVSGEPELPNFANYTTYGRLDHKSPFNEEELLSLSVDDLIKQLEAYRETYKPSIKFNEPSLKGLAKTLRQMIKAEPLRFHNQLHKFLDSDLSFVYEPIEAYRELWSEKVQLPWDEIWSALLDFSQNIVTQDRFWAPENAEERSSFVANRHWIVGSIGRMIEAGTKSDEHAFNEKFLKQAEKVILIFLEKQRGEEFKAESDAVMIAINSPRGQCIEALINLTLRSCRLAKKQNGSHSAKWMHFEPIYNKELARAEIGEYEFATLVANYLPNFLYMSNEWVLANLDNIFDQKNHLKWLCAMKGYAHVNIINKEIYEYLKENRHLFRALDDKNLKERVHEALIQNIAIAYISNYEKLEDESSMIHQLLVRKKYEELSQLIWFIWTQRKDENLHTKVFELWPRLLRVIDPRTREGRKLASKLCDWSVFVDEVNEENKNLLLRIAPFAEEEYNTHDLLESIAKISKKQPDEAYEIWLKMLEGSSMDFPEEAVRTALTNLVNAGSNGQRQAKEIVSKYIEAENYRPHQWLQKIRSENSN